jgi:hypothetical protein
VVVEFKEGGSLAANWSVDRPGLHHAPSRHVAPDVLDTSLTLVPIDDLTTSTYTRNLYLRLYYVCPVRAKVQYTFVLTFYVANLSLGMIYSVLMWP